VANVIQWVWETTTGRYRNLATGQFVGRETILGLVDSIVDRTVENPVATLNTMLADKRLSVADWQTGFARQIKNAYAQQAMLAAGGREQMTPRLWGMVGGSVREQYNYLKDFAKQIESGSLTAAQIEARTKMYLNSSREVYWRVQDMQARDQGMTQERWHAVGDDSTCGPCSDADAMGWQNLGFFAQPGSGNVIAGQTTCLGLTNCRCTKEYR